jgi:beta-xylosidase
VKYSFKKAIPFFLVVIIGNITVIKAVTVKNPLLWGDIPDISIVRVNDTYYMSQTTMHMTPGVPIMESTDMVHWKTISYCYSTLVNNNMMNLANGENAYGKGSWASSIRYKEGTFYVLTFSQTSNSSHLFTTKDIKNGPWKETKLPFWHDPSLVLDDDGRNYVLYGNSDIRIVELNSELTGVKAGGLNKILLANAGAVAGSGGLGAEGTQVYKYNGYYYIFNICWPSGSMRTQICHRGKSLSGAFEGKVVLKSNGVAQGSILQMKDSSWIGYLFQDNGAVGRSPWLIPVNWKDNWPDFNNGIAPASFDMPSVSSEKGTGFVTSDNFSGTSLKLEWQINHNPDNTYWSLSQRPGFFRITTGRVDNVFTNARNTLTQRTFGPKCSGRVSLDISGLKDGDCAGLGALQAKYGFVGVKKEGSGNTIVMNNGSTKVATAPLSQNWVYLRIDMDFTNKTDKTTFFYSTDSINWKPIGNTLQMSYDMPHFMGYRFALFSFATKTAGGIADFDWFQIGSSVNDMIDLYPNDQVSVNRNHVAGSPFGINTNFHTGTPTLNITCQIPKTSPIEMFIYDISGRTVAQIFNGNAAKGCNTLKCYVPPIAKGHYFITGSCNGEMLIRQSILITK